jgi:hypothetical protein
MYFHFFVLGLAVACVMAGFPSTYERSLVGARPSSAAPVDQEAAILAFARAYETTRY